MNDSLLHRNTLIQGLEEFNERYLSPLLETEKNYVHCNLLQYLPWNHEI